MGWLAAVIVLAIFSILGNMSKVAGKETIHCDTEYDLLDQPCRGPERPISASVRVPISGIY
eukprot:5124362-Heterocapsa_arctica.AAC.1